MIRFQVHVYIGSKKVFSRLYTESANSFAGALRELSRDYRGGQIVVVPA